MGILLIFLAVAADNTTQQREYHPTFMAMVKHANAERARYGLPPVEPDPGLMDWSARHAKWMVTNGSLTHSSGVAEIIASGQTGVREVTRAWMNSSGHRAIMLGRYRYCGAAGYVWRGRYYWCMQFSNSRHTVVSELRKATERYVRPQESYSAPVRYSTPPASFGST